MRVTFRQATLDDLDSLLRIEQQAFPAHVYHPINRRQFRYLLSRAQAEIWLAEQDSATGPQVCGAAILFFRKGATYARLYSIAVLPSGQGQGVGTALMEQVEARARAKGLRALRQEVRADNLTLINRHLRRGYRPYGQAADYYPDGSACLKLTKDLNQEPGHE